MPIEVNNPRLNPETRREFERQNEARRSWILTVSNRAKESASTMDAHYGRRYYVDDFSRMRDEVAIVDTDACDVDCSGAIGDPLPNRTAALLVATLEMAREEGCLHDLAQWMDDATDEGSLLDPNTL